MMPKRWMILAAALLGFVAAPVPLFAATIEVATVNLALVGDVDCNNVTPENCQALFTLEYRWLEGVMPGPSPTPTIGGRFRVDGTAYPFLPVTDSSPLDQFAPTNGVPGSASASIVFKFAGVTYPLLLQSFTLTGLFESDGSPSPSGETLLFQTEFVAPVPESSTLWPAVMALFFLGLIAVRPARL